MSSVYRSSGTHPVHLAAESILRSHPGLSILEIGCGDGGALSDLAQRFPRHRFSGLDISRENIAAARVSNPSIEWHAADLLGFDGRFDLVITDSVLHLIDCSDDLLANKLARLLRKGGTLIVSMPRDCLWNRAMIRGRRVLSRFRSRGGDAAILWLARHWYDWPTEALAARLEYLYLPTCRLDGSAFAAVMQDAGIELVDRRLLPNPSIAKLKHSLTIWRS